MGIASTIQAVIRAIANFFGYKYDPKTIAKKEAKETEVANAKNAKAIQDKDVPKVNTNLKDILDGKPLQILVICFILTMCTGCWIHFGDNTKPPIVYIPIEQKATPIPKDSVVLLRQTLDDVVHNKKVLVETDVISYTVTDGWFVPDGVMTILMDKANRWNASQVGK